MQGKRILLGVTGGIAAYKIAVLIRELIKAGAEVKCIMTPASSAFISPLTLATLSKNPVYTEYWDEKTGEWSNHVELALWADLFVIAPLTANSLAKMACGQSDNLLLTTYLSAKCPVWVAPAMDLDMFQHPTTRRNLEQIQSDGVSVLPAQSGELASGLVGQGRMMEPEDIAAQIFHFFSNATSESSVTVLITAGPTYEAIDPVRFIGNRSSGKMGVALALEWANRGAQVRLILGPSHLTIQHPKIQVIPVESAQEMLEATQLHWPKANIGIFCAAVSDYRPDNPAVDKIKKTSDHLTIDLKRNPDILQWAGEHKENQFLVGFALETSQEKSNAAGKLERKKLDAIILNSLKDEGAGFAADTNKIAILDRDNKWTDFELKTKTEVAKDIVDYVLHKTSL